MKDIDKNIQTLTPFGHFCMTIGELPSSYLMSMSYYEQLIWLIKYLKDKVIPAVNNNAEAVIECQNAIIELQNYVDNYFANLDVQDEINAKLDEMAESGELEEIIAQYLQLQGVFAFNNIEAMQQSEEIINGSFMKTYGFRSLNDGGGALYKARLVTTEDTIDNIHLFALANNLLVAELQETDSINVKQVGAYGDGTNDDSDYIDYAINNFKDVYFPSGTYIYNNYNQDVYANKLHGDFAEIKRTGTDGLQAMFRIKHDCSIENLKFNSNNVGRGCVIIDPTDNCYINNCDFTGYSNTYGYYQTDSLLMIGGVNKANVSNCNFHESGYELDPDGENTLNRCITAQNCNIVTISNCDFFEVMQAIATLNNETIIKGCSFNYIKVNPVYNLSYENQDGNLVFTGNYVSSYSVQGVTIRGKRNVISNNIFENTSICVWLAGNCEDVIMANNSFYKIGINNVAGALFSSRDTSYTLKNLMFTGNTADIYYETDSNNGIYMTIPTATNVTITGNNIKYYGRNYGRGINVTAITNLVLTDNIFNDTSLSTTGNVLYFTGAGPSSFIYRDNITGALRQSAQAYNKNLQYIITTSTNYAVSNSNKRLFSGTSAPTSGTWERGDVVFNNLPSAGGNLGWICTTAGSPGTWKSMSTIAS